MVVSVRQKSHMIFHGNESYVLEKRPYCLIAKGPCGLSWQNGNVVYHGNMVIWFVMTKRLHHLLYHRKRASYVSW